MTTTQVWKYQQPLDRIGDVLTFDVPAGGKVLAVANQQEHLAIWVEVDPTRLKKKRRFRVVGTGHELELPVNAHYVGTALFATDLFVLHVWDLGEK